MGFYSLKMSRMSEQRKWQSNKRVKCFKPSRHFDLWQPKAEPFMADTESRSLREFRGCGDAVQSSTLS